MSPPLVLLPGALAGATAGTRHEVPADALHHLRRVLRLADGAAVRVTDGAGHRADARLEDGTAVLTAGVTAVPCPAPRLALAQGLTQGRRAEEAVRAACELGVGLLVPVVGARTQGRPDAAARAAVVGRWQGIAAAALAQSDGVWLPEVASAQDAAGLAAAPPWDGPRLVAVPGADPLPDVLPSVLPSVPPSVPVGAGADATVGVAVGPEGGWTAAEVATLVAAGWVPVGLGPTVLRSEHAGPAALAVLAAATGRWALGR